MSTVVAALARATLADASAPGQQRADAQWGYDHGLRFDEIDERHPLWLEAAIETFVHSLVFNGSQPLTDRQIRAVMRRKAGAEPFPMPLDADPSCSADDSQYTPTDPGSDAELLLAAYALRHARALKSPTEHRYLVVEAGSWGLGNRLFALVSGLALAVATDRVLLLRDWFAFPSRLGDLFAPPPLPGGWDALSFERAVARVLPSMRGGWAGLRAASSVISLLELPAQLHVVDGRRVRAPSDHLAVFCDQFNERYPAQFVHVLSNTNYLPLLLHNRWPAPRLALLGRRPFHALASWLLQPAPAVRAAADGFLGEQRRGALANRSLVGVHIRTQDWMRVPPSHYWRCLDTAAPAGGGAAWLVAADADDVAPPAEMLERGAVVVQRRAARSKADYAVEADGAGLFDAAVDLVLLASCDTLVVSPMSSFGAFAHAWADGGAIPWKATAYGECVREATAEPFFHHWPDVARELRERRGDGDGHGHGSAAECALPPTFYGSSEARSLGLWLLGGEASAAELEQLVEGAR